MKKFYTLIVIILALWQQGSCQINFGAPISNFVVSPHDCGFEDWCYHRDDKTKYHNGTDHLGSLEQNILAIGDGKVVHIEPNFSGGHQMGKIIIIEHEVYKGFGGKSKIYSLYAHLNSINVNKGQYVKKGQVIAGMGASGGASQSQYGFGSNNIHLHFEIKTKNCIRTPSNCSKGAGYSIDKNKKPSANGFYNPTTVINNSSFQFIPSPEIQIRGSYSNLTLTQFKSFSTKISLQNISSVKFTGYVGLALHSSDNSFLGWIDVKKVNIGPNKKEPISFVKENPNYLKNGQGDYKLYLKASNKILGEINRGFIVSEYSGSSNPVNVKIKSGTSSSGAIKTGLYSGGTDGFNYKVKEVKLKKAKPGEIALKDYFSGKGYSNLSPKRTSGFDFYWGTMPYKENGESKYKKAFFLGHLIKKNSNILIGALFVPSPRSVKWIYIVPEGNQMKIFFTKNISDQNSIFSLKNFQG